MMLKLEERGGSNNSSRMAEEGEEDGGKLPRPPDKGVCDETRAGSLEQAQVGRE